jgi:uncharacterized RDD family membrane protein YckC
MPPQYPQPYPQPPEWVHWRPDIYWTPTAIVLPPAAYRTQIAVAPGQLVQAFAGPGRRLAARMIDGLVMLGIIMPIIGVLVDTHAPPAVTSLVVLVLIACEFAYEVVLTTIYGGGLGKIALGIRVVRSYDTRRTPHFGAALGRWASYLLFSLLCYFLMVGVLDQLWLLWDRPRRQCLHDKAAGTIVIRTLEYQG